MRISFCIPMTIPSQQNAFYSLIFHGTGCSLFTHHEPNEPSIFGWTNLIRHLNIINESSKHHQLSSSFTHHKLNDDQYITNSMSHQYMTNSKVISRSRTQKVIQKLPTQTLYSSFVWNAQCYNAVWCNVLQRVAVLHNTNSIPYLNITNSTNIFHDLCKLQKKNVIKGVMQCGAMCCSGLQCVATL